MNVPSESGKSGNLGVIAGIRNNFCTIHVTGALTFSFLNEEFESSRGRNDPESPNGKDVVDFLAARTSTGTTTK